MEAITSQKCDHGRNIERWRKWRGMKQDVLAELVGISQASLSACEKKSKIEPELLQKFAKALNIPVEAITELEEGSTINITTNTFNGDDAIANSVNYNPTFNPIDKIIELCNEKNALYERMLEERNALYERMLKEKGGVIELLEEVLRGFEGKEVGLSYYNYKKICLSAIVSLRHSSNPQD